MPSRNGYAKICSCDVDGLSWIGLSLILVELVYGDAAGRFKADFSFVPNCNAHTNLKATFSERRCALELCSYGTPRNGVLHQVG